MLTVKTLPYTFCETVKEQNQEKPTFSPKKRLLLICQ
jgi:hypothetical protein